MEKNFFKKISFITTAVILLVFFNNQFSDNFLKNFVLSVLAKPLGPTHSFLTHSKKTVFSWFNTSSLLKENQWLQEENRQLISANLKISELEKENQFLRKELGVVQKKNFQVSLARIFHQQFDGQFQTAMIDIGTEDGIAVGMPVIFDGEVLYGIVKEVYSHSSLVYLISDPRIVLSVKIVESEIMGRSRGILSNGVSLELITNQEEVKIGDLAITSGLDGLPSALVVGTIRKAEADRGGLFQKIEIDPQFKSLLIDRVFVLKI